MYYTFTTMYENKTIRLSILKTWIIKKRAFVFYKDLCYNFINPHRVFRRLTMKEKFLSVSSIFTAVAASLCWSGGLILASLGLGSLGSAYFANLTKYKPIFVVITGLLIYKSYTIMEKKNTTKGTRILFWISTILAIFALYYPTILRLFGIS